MMATQDMLSDDRDAPDASTLLKALHNGDWRVRKDAARKLGDASLEWLSDELAERVSSEHVGERNAALTALIKQGAPALPSLARLLGHEDADVRNLASLAIGLIGDLGAEDILEEALAQEGDPNVRYMMVEALGRIGNPAAGSTLMRALSDEEYVAGAAISGLGSMRWVRATDDIIALLGHEMLGGIAANALASIGHPRAFLPLVRAAQDDPAVADIFTDAAARVYAATCDRYIALYAALRCTIDIPIGSPVVAATRRALARGDQPQTWSRFAEWLGFPLDPPTRLAHGLAEEPIAAARSGARINRHDVSSLLIEFASDDASARALAAEAFATLVEGPLDRRVLRGLAEHEDPVVREALARYVRRTCDDAARDVTAKLLEDADPTVRASAAGIPPIEQIGDMAQAMARFFTDESPLVRAAAARAAAQAAGSGARHLLAGLLEDTDDTVVVAALESIGTLKLHQAAPLAYELLKHESAAVRAAALHTLTSLSSCEVLEAASTLLLTDPAPEVRAAAVRLLARYGTESARDLVWEALTDDDVRVRRAALEILPEVSGPGCVALVARLLVDDDLHEEALRCILEYGELAAEGLERKVAKDAALYALPVGVALVRTPGAYAESAMRHLLRDERELVRWSAAAAIICALDATTRAAVTRMLPKRESDEDTAALLGFIRTTA